MLWWSHSFNSCILNTYKKTGMVWGSGWGEYEATKPAPTFRNHTACPTSAPGAYDTTLPLKPIVFTIVFCASLWNTFQIYLSTHLKKTFILNYKTNKHHQMIHQFHFWVYTPNHWKQGLKSDIWPVSIAALSTAAKRRKQPKCPSGDECQRDYAVYRRRNIIQP